LVSSTTLENGLRVVTERMEHLRSVSVGIWVDVGSRDEREEQAGFSHLLEHMIFKGTQRRTALSIAKEIDAIGGMSNAFTSRERTCFHAKVLDYHLGEIVDLLSDIFLNSLFSAEELKREQEVVLQEIKMVEDTPDEHVHQLLPQLIWPEIPMGRPILGTVESVTGATSESLKTYIHDSYAPGRIIISAAGNLDHQGLVKLVEPLFGTLGGQAGPGRTPAPEPLSGDLIKEKDLEQVHLCLGLKGVSALSPDRFPCALLNVLLGGSMSSRLFQEVREKRGLAYSVYSYLSSYSDAGMLGLYLGVEPSRTREALEVVLEVMEELGQGIEEEELAKAKEHLKGSIFLAAESTDSRMSRLAKNEFNFGRYIPYEEVAAKIQATTPEMVSSLAARILDPKELALVALGPGVEKALGKGWYRRPNIS